MHTHMQACLHTHTHTHTHTHNYVQTEHVRILNINPYETPAITEYSAPLHVKPRVLGDIKIRTTQLRPTVVKT